MTEIDRIAHLIRIGLVFKKISLSAIIKWADKQIEKGKTDSLLFDLSVAKSSHEVIESLTKKIEWNYKSLEIRSLILGYYKEYLNANTINWEGIQQELICFFDYLEYENSNEKAEDFLYYLNDDYQLRIDGYGGSLSMPNFLIENLAKFDNYHELQGLLKRNEIVGFEIKKITTR